jgi:hypothetical protein
MRNFFWSDGNAKMVKTAKAWKTRFGRKARFISFNIPRLQSETGQKTCPYAGMCADICYAGQGRMAMSMATEARERNLEIVNSMTAKQLTTALVADIARMNSTTHIRIHDSGDFFNRTYYRAWIQAAEECGDIIFYAYTKSLPFLEWDKHPKNFRVVQSLGGKRDAKIDLERPHAKIFATDTERRIEGYCDGNVSDMPAVLGQTKIGLVYHGTRNLTAANLVKLRA